MQVRLTNYRPEWAKAFDQEVKLLTPLFMPNRVTFEHFGSTSVPGMMAKPVIDIMGIVSDIRVVDVRIGSLCTLGYDAGGEWGIPGRRLFRKGGEDRTHHLHFYAVDNPEIYRHLMFRDYLRTHPNEVLHYSQQKQRWADQYPDTREYSRAKHDFVSALEARALTWGGLMYPARDGEIPEGR